MKFNKKNLLSLLAIVLCAFIIIPLILILFNINPYTISEGMTEYDMTDENTNLHRVDMSGVTYNNGISDVSGGPDDYIYCLGGDISCDTGDISSQGVYSLDGGNNIGNTYKHNCYDVNNIIIPNEFVKCNSKLGDMGNITFYNENMDISYDISNNVDASFNGFTNVFQDIPMQFDASHTYLILYDPVNGVSFESTPCFLYQSEKNCLTFYNDDDNNDATTYESSGSICVADNGAETGDPLCCGQSGVVQNTKYNCPAETPYCEGYKCGSTWGNCVKTKST